MMIVRLLLALLALLTIGAAHPQLSHGNSSTCETQPTIYSYHIHGASTA